MVAPGGSYELYNTLESIYYQKRIALMAQDSKDGQNGEEPVYRC